MEGARVRSLLFFISLFLLFLFCAEGTRPAIESAEYWISIADILNNNFRSVVARIDFDADLWVAADSFLCGKAEKACLPLSCTPCDWSGQDPSGCSDSDCCGPAEVGGDVYDNVEEWCADEPLHNYTSLNLGRPSDLVTLEQGEIAYFRFYVGPENTCRPIKIAVRPTYGVPTVRVSNLHAFPDTENSEWRRGSFPIGQGMAQNYVTVCPVAHSDYRLGTYSIAVQAALSTAFTVEALVSSQSQPLLPPSVRLSCSIVSDDEFSEDAAETFCLEDGLTVSHEFVDSRNEYSELVLPVSEGCFTVSVSATLEDASGEVDLYCLPRDPDSLTTADNALMGRAVTSENRLSFSACFEETTFIHCSVFPKTENTVHMIFSTVSNPYRVPLFTEAATSLTYQDGLTAAGAVFFGLPKRPCIDFLTDDCFEWVTAPSTDPLVYYPPPAQLAQFNAPLDLYHDYGDTILASPLSKSLFVVVVTSYEDETPFPINLLLRSGSLAVLTITNRLGEPLNLPGGGEIFSRQSSTRQSVSNYIPHIPYSALTEIQIEPFCNEEDYEAFQALLDDLIEDIEEDNTIVTVTTVTYAVDVYNSALASSSCVFSAVGELDNFFENISRTDQTFCRYNRFTEAEEYERDPCCNSELLPVSCCFPFSASVSESQSLPPDEDELEGLCGVPECAVSYFGDLSTALNQLNDPIQGCSSGIQDPDAVLADLVNNQYENIVRYCLNLVGLSDTFEGTDCSVDSDCGADEDSICDFLKGKCALPSTSDVEDDYLTCYIDRMPASLEDYIRREILPSSAADYPTDSQEFFDALREAGSVDDCVVPGDALNVEKRARYLWDAESLECKANELGLPEEDTEGIEKECPTGVCLGKSCRQDYSNCFANCNADYTFEGTDETCAPEPICTVSDLDDCSGSHCAYCPTDHSLPCTLVDGVDADDCNNQIGCELPDGRVLFGLSEEECRERDLSCTIPCPGEGCLSLSESTGVCVVEVSNFPTCQNVAKTYSIETVYFDGSSCLIVGIQNQDDCQDFEDLSLLSTNWERCESYSVDECGDVDVSVTQRYLECFVADWHECLNQQECEASGACSDREFATIVRSETESYPISVQTGVCFNSGFYDASGADLPTCLEDMDRPGVGCRDLLYEEESDCSGSFVDGGEYANREWVTPAFTEGTCRNQDASRFGCLLPGPESQLLWLNSSECECRGGSPQFSWEWTQGVWRGGVPRSLTWKEAEEQAQYEVTNSLSFLDLETWVADSVEEQFLYILRSDVICQSNFISYSLTTLVCDCFSGEEDDDAEEESSEGCYEQNENNRENLVGISAVCAGERSAVKGPSGYASFAEFSASKGCSLLNLSIVNEAWFDAVVADVAVSFRFEDHNTRGTVRNSDQATVGELVGDGTVISFEKSGRIRSFRVCLRVVQREPSNSEYSERDFGTSTSDYEYIVPLGLHSVDVEELGNAEFWCSQVDYDEVTPDSDGVVRLFPVYREEDYEDEEEDYVSDRTKVLMYVLGCFYAVDLLLFGYYFGHKAENGRRSQKRRQIAFPLSVLFSILCVFRICFMFMYPNGVFYQEPLQEFIVFEIPTFLLFTMVIISIGFWQSLSNRSHFFVKDTTYVVYIGVVLVWCLWIVVTVVYSEVILETSSGESPCVGRVPDSNDELEENTRILTIVYQSIIVVVTLILAAIFSFYTQKLLAAAKNISRVKKFILFIGGLITFSFLLRCILYVIILAVEFTSSIYMFITLFLTEVLLMLFCSLQFNNMFFIHFGSTYSGRSSTGGANKSSKGSSKGSSVSDNSKEKPRTDLDTVMDD